MSKLWMIFLLILVGCQSPSQMSVDTEKELVGLSDIPLTNMPGHAPPEVPLECICPKMFGLDYNPCCVAPKPTPFKWHSDPEEALRDAGEHGKMVLVLFHRQDQDSQKLRDRLKQPRVKCVLDKHYTGLLIPGDEELYNMWRSTSEKPMKWLPRDFSMSPSLMFVKVQHVESMNVNMGTSLPIIYEGRVNVDLHELLTKTYKASQ